ncbi:MAG: hypothetical protein IKZ38_02165 [Clostridia bacterium]|nr:hypothetical protein [Clostridia bacterium]
MTVLKIFIIVLLTLIVLFPMLPFAAKVRKVSTIHALKYEQPHNKKNLYFVGLSILFCVLILSLLSVIDDIAGAITNIEFVDGLFVSISQATSSNVDFVSVVALVLIMNAIILYGYSLVKFFIKSCILNPAYGMGKLAARRERRKQRREKRRNKRKNKKRKKKGEPEEEKPQQEEKTEPEQEDKKGKRILTRERKVLKEEPRGKIRSAIWSLFFEEPDYVYAKNWVIRTRKVLQGFIYMVEILYTILFITVLSASFFVLPAWVYNLLINVLKFQEWYLYPFISLIILQEVCNFFNTKLKETDEKEEAEEKKEAEQEVMENNLRSLHLEIQRRFDGEHNLRYYPEAGKDTAIPYLCTNRPYASALNFIQNKMKEKSGRIVHSYMECLDSSYNDKNVYFCASFYSEFGDYLIHYTYTRLLSGMRMVFILSDKNRVLALRKYISDALMNLIDATEDCTWRVYTSQERLDQADILIATPEDFKNDEMVENYPSFFEEVSNAVFIDADELVEKESYLCPVIAKRLQRATNERVKFIFLSKAILRGFTASTLPKFFCVDDVLSFSSANENEAVAYTLWNKESKRNVVYNRHGQKLSNIETIIAEQAVNYGVDGVRVITPGVLDRSERDVLDAHDIEINKFYKQPLPKINYMIYTDDRNNLSAALYTATRFRGVEKSLVHIISNPYLLREYFMDRILSEEYINRSAFIQPRVAEHVNKAKLSYLKLFCDATTDEGMNVMEFEKKMLSVMDISKQRRDAPLCPYCAQDVVLGDYPEINVERLAAYLLAALYDDEDTPKEESVATRVKDYYIIIDAPEQDGYTLVKDKKIKFKHVKEILNKVFACNDKVKLCINDQIIGELDTFPSRVPLEYVVGQSMVFDNTEYEIEQISKDNKIIFLRHENVTFKNCLDTIFLRRYGVKDNGLIGTEGVFNKTNGMLEEIRVGMHSVDFTGETYGFYSLLSNCQTLDFVRGAVGNPHIDKSIVDANARKISNGKVLYVTLKTRMEISDEVRLLLSAVFNEFLRTMFPKTYRCIAVCPVLENPIPYNDKNEPNDYLGRVKSLYPYLTNLSIQKEEGDESYKKEMQFLFINDCSEDAGVLDWFYDQFGHYMHEFLANVYSYLHWLKIRPELNHYIYFGADKLAECFDVEKACEIFDDYNIILSEVGTHDYETAGDNIVDENPERCAFCGNILQSGRFIRFEDGRYVCIDCDKQSVRTAEELAEAEKNVRDYLEKEYPDVLFGSSTVTFKKDAFAKEDMTISQINYRVDYDLREIYVEKETPRIAIECSILRGIVQMWQNDNELLISYADAQLEYEECKYLRLKNYDNKVMIVEEKYDENLASSVQFIKETIADESSSVNSSFAFMREQYSDILKESEIGNEISDEEPGELYDPNKTPRFWKRYLRGERITDGEDRLSADDREQEDIPDGDENPDGEVGEEVAAGDGDDGFDGDKIAQVEGNSDESTQDGSDTQEQEEN